MVKKLTFFENMKDYINHGAESVNNSKFFIAIVMIAMNLGSKYVAINFSKSQEAYLKLIFGRQLLIFSVAFMATRNIYISFMVLIGFVILADYAFNENSRFCVLPKSFKDLKHAIDTNNDGKISEEELKNAIEILSKSKKQKELQKTKEAFTHFKSSVNN